MQKLSMYSLRLIFQEVNNYGTIKKTHCQITSLINKIWPESIPSSKICLYQVVEFLWFLIGVEKYGLMHTTLWRHQD